MQTPMTAIAIHPGGVVAVPLGVSGSGRAWVIGRAKDVDIVVDDPSLSRRHAILHGGTTFEIEDLGSENGTTIVHQAGVPAEADTTLKLTPRRLVRGERGTLNPRVHAQLGRVTLLVQPGTAAGAPWRAPPPPEATPVPSNVIVTSPAIQRVFWLAEKFAQGKINIMLLGETGVGKEVLAEHIHRASPRRSGPFMRLNCASFRGELLESELFGHERGAFTGAVAAKRGVVELADGGTLFLDEVGETPPDLQARLLRFLEDRRVVRIGSTESRVADVRIVSATNRDPAAEVAAGRFRNDLYFRLNGVSHEIPPLRDRPEDIVPLAEHFARRHAMALGVAVPILDDSALAAIKRQPFPGNARELRNLIERALLLADPGQPLRAEHLMLETKIGHPEPGSSGPLVREAADEDEKRRVVEMLDRYGGNQTRAAKELGMTRKALIVRLERFGITRPRRPSDDDM